MAFYRGWRGKSFRARARTFRSRGYGRRFKNFSGGMGGGLMYTAGGAVAGYMAPRVVPYQDAIITALAVAPVKMPRIVRRLAGGYVIGMLAKGFLGGSGTGAGTGDYI